MNVQSLISQMRLDLDDLSAPYLWSDVELLNYLNEAEREACRRARLLKDATTTTYCRITLTSGTADYSLNEKVLYVRRAKISTESIPLVKIDRRGLDAQFPGWESDTAVTPTHFCLDTDSQKIKLYPTPTNFSGTVYLYLHVVRMPAADMTSNSSPEIPSRWHMSMRYWALYLAWSHQDEDKYNPEKAATAAQMFADEFGPRTPAIEEVWINERHGYDEYEGLL